MLTTRVDRPGRPRLAVCDRRCEKAWGVNGRRADTSSAIEFDQDDDVVYLADDEVGEAPRDPGTYEAGEGKPMHPEAHGKWCLRECERCAIVEVGEAIAHPDYSVRQYNQPWLHPDAPAITKRQTGEVFRPDMRET